MTLKDIRKTTEIFDTVEFKISLYDYSTGDCNFATLFDSVHLCKRRTSPNHFGNKFFCKELDVYDDYVVVGIEFKSHEIKIVSPEHVESFIKSHDEQGNQFMSNRVR